MYDSSKRKMMLDEIELLSRIQSPFIVSFYGAFLDANKKCCVILEYMNRGSIEALMRNTRLLDIIKFVLVILTRLPTGHLLI